MASVKTNGYTLKAWYNSDWGSDSFYLEEVALKINGEPHEDIIKEEINDTDAIELISGVVLDEKRRDWSQEVKNHFRAWERKQNSVTFVVDVPKDKQDEFATMLKSIGAKKVV